MANFGLSHPIMAKLNVATGAYSDVFKCGKAINTSVTPNYNTAALFADNVQDEDIRELKNATVELGVNTLPIKAGEVLFGHKITKDEDEDEVSNIDDSGYYVGYGFITAEMISGEKKYRGCFLPKVKFSEGTESYKTKGDSIEFSTPSISGTAIGNNAKDWRRKSKYFDTEEECDAWILKKMDLSGQLETLYAQAGIAQVSTDQTNAMKEVTTKEAAAKKTDTQTTDK